MTVRPDEEIAAEIAAANDDGSALEEGSIESQAPFNPAGASADSGASQEAQEEIATLKDQILRLAAEL